MTISPELLGDWFSRDPGHIWPVVVPSNTAVGGHGHAALPPRADHVSTMRIILGDPDVGFSHVTGGLFPAIGGWVLSADADIDRYVVQAEPLRAAPRHDNTSFTPSGLPSFTPRMTEFITLDAIVTILCGAAFSGLNERLEGLPRRESEFIDTPRFGYSDQSGAMAAAVFRADSAAAPTSQATQRIRAALGWSEAQLAGLFGITRKSWRDWMSGSAVPRLRNRKRLYLLRHALDVRERVAPGQPVSTWFESPIGARESDTPADLFRAEQSELLSTLAAAVPVPTGGPYELAFGLTLGGLHNADAAEAAMREASIIGTDDRE